MISQDLRDDIDNVIGVTYTPKIIAFLNEHGILNNKNQSYKAESIRQIVTNKTSNGLVELYIEKCVNFWREKRNV